MPHPIEPLAHLTPEQVAERLSSMQSEGRHWRRVLDQAGVLNEGIGEVVEAIADGTVAALSLTSLVDARGMSFISDAMGAMGRALAAAQRLQPVVATLIEIAGERGDELDRPIAVITDAMHAAQ